MQRQSRRYDEVVRDCQGWSARQAVGKKNWLFAGADCGGERAAAIHSLLETAKLNDVNPQAWLADVLDRIGDGASINRIDELLSWQWAAADEQESHEIGTPV